MAVGRSLPTSSPAQAGVELIPKEAPPLAATPPSPPGLTPRPPLSRALLHPAAWRSGPASTTTPSPNLSLHHLGTLVHLAYERRLADVALADDGNDRRGRRR
ncbi:Os10g0433001 [Oryza sativa Japonica Group]|uniref:Os10g0433001 protein n=1 Tax=Oryza sativa subsp. japonica TaxID=39947 RepID=A0A0P0XUY3_ORYSJ|nr:hypothetical protein DAI22_10g107700 [Oryza sativa Japonica Group]BAT10967.1 Os10g0433001 [Oryza sativa Japonica Group]